MPTIIPYNRRAAIEYAQDWAFSRNPRYLNFDGMGGDCTNFISQCIYAGCGVMNYTRDIGWYYNNARDRAAAWSGVPHLFRFLTSNKGIGPFGVAAPVSDLEAGDIIQLGDENGRWYHSMLITGHVPNRDPLVASHTYDALSRPLSSYIYNRSRGIKMAGGRHY